MADSKGTPIRVIHHDQKVKDIKDEGGKTKLIQHTLTLSDGSKLLFEERNVFDFGRVINPAYSIAEGKDPGGLPASDDKGTFYWNDFQPSRWALLADGQWKEATDKERKEASDKWKLPPGYKIVEDTKSWAGIFGDDEETAVTKYKIVDDKGNELKSEGGWLQASGGTKEEALSSAFQILAVKLLDRGGWGRVRDMTAQEVAAYKYVNDHGYYADSGIRMESEANDTVASQEQLLEWAVEEGQLAGAMPADIWPPSDKRPRNVRRTAAQARKKRKKFSQARTSLGSFKMP